jgi:hypothetical protein
VPSLFVNSQLRWLQTGQVADSEQVAFGWFSDGLDHPEWCALLAPRSLLINAARGDFFPIGGARETFAEARRVFALAGAPQAIEMRESEGGHVYGAELRREAESWLMRELGVSGAVPETSDQDFTPEPQEALWCTRTGQVAESEGTASVFELNRRRVAELAQSHASRLSAWLEQPDLGRREILQVVGVDLPAAQPMIQAIDRVVERGEYRVFRLAYWTEPDVYVPASYFVPHSSGSGAAVLVIDGRGDGEASEALGAKLVREGFRVLSIHPRGMGATRWDDGDQAGAYDSILGAEANLTHDAWLLGANLIGWRVRDVLAGLRCLRRLPGVAPSRLYLLGLDPLGATPAVFAAALDDGVAATALVRPLLSYRSVADARLYRVPSSLMPWGVLQRFDLPQVAALAAERPLLLVNVVGASGAQLRQRDLDALGQGQAPRLGRAGELVQAGEPLNHAVDWLAERDSGPAG